MARYAWCTDTHLDFISHDTQKLITFVNSIKRLSVDGLLLTGDISVGPQLSEHLGLIEAGLEAPIYFVLGNHDYYHASIENMRGRMKELTNVSQYLKYLPTVPYVPISQSTALVGHDGWYDGLNGDRKNSTFVMSDWSQIQEFYEVAGNPRELKWGNYDMAAILKKSQELALEATQHVHDGIKAAIRYHDKIIVMTHFPPFVESHMHEGRPGGMTALPWYTSKIMGDMLLNAAQTFPNKQFVVLAGHTHGKWDGQIREHKNLHCHVGHADYGRPEVQLVLDV
jgi:predicted phosphohydrolase